MQSESSKREWARVIVVPVKCLNTLIYWPPGPHTHLLPDCKSFAPPQPLNALSGQRSSSGSEPTATAVVQRLCSTVRGLDEAECKSFAPLNLVVILKVTYVRAL
eukprot:10130-Heterococcus_DN1.PRE.1